MEIDLTESQYALRICVLDALNHKGDVITRFSLKDMRDTSRIKLFETPEDTWGDFFWVNENTCPTNLLGVDSEIYDGPDEDPHGLVIQVGLVPQLLVKEHVELINLDGGEWDFTDGNGSNSGNSNSEFFNKLIRLYKSVYHMLRNSFLTTDIGLGTMKANPFGQVVYFEVGDAKGMARVNWLVCEMLKDHAKYFDLIDNPKGRVIDANQAKLAYDVVLDVNDDINFTKKPDERLEELITNTTYNELIYGLPEALLGEKGMGIEKLIETLLPESKDYLINAEGMKHHITQTLISNYYTSDSVSKVKHN